LAAAIVVLVITVAIFFEFRELARSFTARVTLIVGVQTFTLLAIFYHNRATIGFLATVAPIPIASTIVILVITIFVFLVFW